MCVFNVYLFSSKKFLVDCTKSAYVWWFKLIKFYVFEKTNCILYFLLWYFTDRYQQDETFNIFLLLKESSFHLTAKEEVGRVVGQQYRNVLATIKGRTIDTLNGSPLCYGNSFYNVPFKALCFRINILPLKSLDV